MSTTEFRSAAPALILHPDGIRPALLAGLVLVLLLLAFRGGLWAGAAKEAFPDVAPMSGTVVLESNVKRVQDATGGTVSAILVRDGDRVEQGALLLRLDEMPARTNLQTVTRQLDEITARRMRLAAELNADGVPATSQDLNNSRTGPEIGALIRAERKLSANRREVKMGRKAQLHQHIAQLRQEVDGLAARQWSKGRELELIGTELEGAENLWSQNLMPLTGLASIQHEAARIAGERAQLRAQQAETAGRVAETELQIIQLDQDLRAEVMKDLREMAAKEAELVERRIAAEHQLQHIEIRAPQTGFVDQLAVHRLGGVIRRGDTLMLIVPEHDALVVEAKIAPHDIDHVHMGQTASVRFTAFDQPMTAGLEGRVTRISADLIDDQQTGAAYYSARLALNPASEDGTRSRLLSGMPAEVYFRPVQRTVLSHFVTPLRDQFTKAFTQR